MKRKQEDDVPRPPCACGKPATDRLELKVNRLVLERDAGVKSQPYWAPSYRYTRVSVEALICGDCLARDIKIGLTVSATVEKGKPVP